jgi:hypothetical protein
MPIKESNGNTYKIFKGRAKPINLYRNGEQLAGYVEGTFEGQNILLENTYEDEFSNIQIRGGFLQEGVTAPKAESLSIVEPTFASNYKVTFKEGTIEIPKVIVLDDGTEVDAELKGVRNIQGETSHYDYIEVVDGSVKLYKVIKSIDITTPPKGVVYFANKAYTASFSVYIFTEDITWQQHVFDVGLCTAFTINGFSEVAYNSRLIPYGISMSNARIYFSIKNADVGVESSATSAEKVEAFKNWLKEMSDAGTPVTIWYAATTPTVTDITNSDIGRAILNLNPKTYYSNTNISVTAEGGIPSVSATAKVAYQ